MDVIRNLFALIAVFSIVSQAQVKVNINSGNPAYPFPQFQLYNNPTAPLGNLGTNNAVGVTHAEMEKTIREAYQIMMNRAERPGGGVGGIDYVYFNSECNCTEGDGYGMLGAVAMADKTTFDGLWLWVHDKFMNRTKRYSDCQMTTPDYKYSQLPMVYHNPDNSAADGDFDIALALLLAYRQWGEFMGINDGCGNPISYKQAAIDFLTALTDTIPSKDQLGASYDCGDIGLDGYFKGGDTWIELTGWATGTAQSGFPKPPEFKGPGDQHIDYTAPAYFHQFADFLAKEDSAQYAWNIYQFRRAAASSDWLMGQLLTVSDQLPFAGWVALSGANQATFSKYNEGEDFRNSWRTILNYVWHGTPSYSWNPENHQIITGTQNNYERDIGLRYAKFLWDARQSPWNNGCTEVANSKFEYWGPSVLRQNYSLTGDVVGSFSLNWVPGTGSISAVVAQDYSLMAELYRTCETTWDAIVPGDGYLTSVPKYYHGWFRLLGMLVLSGNYPSPSTIEPGTNLKVYCAIDKTFAFEKDTVTYTIDYRNFGSVDAAGVTIIDTLHPDFTFVSATGGGQYNNTSHTVAWNMGTVPGYKSSMGAAPTQTMGQVQLKVVIKSANEKQYRNKVTISCSNGTGWTSNEYPNNITSVMQRNYLDIARRALVVDYKASKDLVKPGETVEFTIEFENSSDAGWINGGRPGVRFSFSFGDANLTSDGKKMRFRLFHDANEAYIDYGNYRVSYFMYDPEIQCYSGDPGCTKGWGIRFDFHEGVETENVKVFQENIVEGQDARGKWNQRVVLQFSDPLDPKRNESLSAYDYLVRQYYGNAGINIHKGGSSPLRLQWELFNSTYMPPQPTWGQHWSWDASAVDANESSMLFPITNDWTDPDNPDDPVDRWHPKACSKASHTVDNILVEEWDGYTWRRVAGNGPMPGREVNNVVVCDTIPAGFTLASTPEATFNGSTVLPTQPSVTGNRIITWAIPKMQVQEKGTIKFLAKADGSCPGAPDLLVVNRAWVSADKESPFADSSEIAVSCDTVLKPPPPDHIDIILDTVVVDSSKDAEFVRLTMDEGTQTVVAYAVVRDKNGKFIRRVNGAVWTSRDATVADAAAVSPTSWQGVIAKAGGGATIVTVSEPGAPELKPDSMAITAIETPPWPAISKAVMLDESGELIPDMLSITLNDTFHVNQRFDSVLVTYRGASYAFAATELPQQPYLVLVPFTMLTTVDPEPSGQVTLVMTVDGEKKKVVKDFTDGVGPALTAVALSQDMAGSYDTLKLSFTEEVNMPTLVGQTLQLIKTAANDTVFLSVMAFKGPEIYKETEVVVYSPSGMRPQEGDLLRLLPGTAGGTLADRKKNLPHRLNKPVMIPERPAQLGGGMYVDENADGIVDAVYLQFVKPVQVSDLSVSILWAGAQRLDNITGTPITYGGTDQSLVRIALPETYMAANGVKTSGAMFVRVRFISNVNETRNAEIADMAAPVLLGARLQTGTADTTGSSDDTLYTSFSEPVRIGATPYPFQFLQKKTQPYTLTLELAYVKGDSAVFKLAGVDGVSYPEAGDEVYINPVSAVGDSGMVWQNNVANRRVSLQLRRTLSWGVQVLPNPSNPELILFDTASVMIRIVSDVNVHTPIAVSDATISIYDKVGNAVVRSAPFVTDARGVVFYWNGTNRHRRKVADGTYVGIVTVNDEGAQGTKRIKIGIARKKLSAIGG